MFKIVVYVRFPCSDAMDQSDTGDLDIGQADRVTPELRLKILYGKCVCTHTDRRKITERYSRVGKRRNV